MPLLQSSSLENMQNQTPQSNMHLGFLSGKLNAVLENFT
jgi:hypothetical protein